MYIHDIEINLEKRFVAKQGEKIPLRQKDFQILSLLVRNRGRVLKRSDIESYIWGEETELSDSTLDVHISYLREHFEKPMGVHLIKTVHGIGFMIE
jgi:DNA-binding response OmpR family regulator